VGDGQRERERRREQAGRQDRQEVWRRHRADANVSVAVLTRAVRRRSHLFSLSHAILAKQGPLMEQTTHARNGPSGILCASRGRVETSCGEVGI